MTRTEDRLSRALGTAAARIAASPDLAATVARGRTIRRRRTAASAAVLVALLAGGAATVGSFADRGPEKPAAPSGALRPIAAGPLATRVQASTVSYGNDVFVWGGQAEPDHEPGEKPLSTSGAAPCCSPAVAPGLLADGAVYDASSDTWHRVSASPLPGRVSAPAVATAQGVLVLGGSRSGDFVTPDRRDGALWRPATNTWRKIADAPFCVGQASVRDNTVFAAGLDCSTGDPAFGSYSLTSQRWTQGPAPALNTVALVDFRGSVAAVTAFGDVALLTNDDTSRNASLSGTQRWTALPPVPDSGVRSNTLAAKDRVTSGAVTGDDKALVAVEAIANGAGGTAVWELNSLGSQWVRLLRLPASNSGHVTAPLRFDAQAFLGDRLLVWHDAHGVSWFSLDDRAAGHVATGRRSGAVRVSTPAALVPLSDGRFLWWGGHTGETIPSTHYALSAGGLLTLP